MALKYIKGLSFQPFLQTNPTTLKLRNHVMLIRFEALMFGCTFVGHEELEDLSLGHSGKKRKIFNSPKRKQASFHGLKVLEDECRQLHRCKDSHPLHPRVLKDLCSAEAQCCISNQQL